ncbi:MAG: hypothetical protein HOD85_30395 [Deltaproteobacteria bacterium]|jgi:methylmalonyl-CoA mutase, N-terminal domain|nr:hypothetical protein [Deltaproteobacteria bacterium]MBT4642917.1 hypothetical protein [Deltaproteobacteria bacterium]
MGSSRSGIPLQDFYNYDDVQNDFVKNIPKPGEYPFTRGHRSKAQPVGAWIHRELSGEGGPVKSNEQLKYLIEQGQKGIDVIGDAATQGWMDPDHPLVVHSVGTQGVSACCRDDYLKLYKDIPLDAISISTSLPPLFSLVGLVHAANEANVPIEKLRGSLIQAPLYTEDCGYACNLPIELRIRLATDTMEFCTLHMPKYHSYLEDTYFFSESGLVTAVEEIALGFVQIRLLVREMLKRGHDIDSFAPRIAILVNCGMDFFEEIAKIRATRHLFARLMKEEFGAKDSRSLSVVIACHTSGISLTAQQPVNNIIRGSIQALALVLSGVHAIEISAFDEAYRTPSPESHMVGLRTQQVIELETGVTKVLDPLGGSYYLENLTKNLEEKIWEMVEEIEDKGDPAVLSENGFFKGIFQNAMERYSNQIKSGDLSVVGLNVLQIPPEEDTLLKEVSEQKIEPYYERIKEIEEMKNSRNKNNLKKALRKLYTHAQSPDANLVAATIEAMAANATAGEITGTLRMAYGGPYDYHGLVKPPVEGVDK